MIILLFKSGLTCVVHLEIFLETFLIGKNILWNVQADFHTCVGKVAIYLELLKCIKLYQLPIQHNFIWSHLPSVPSKKLQHCLIFRRNILIKNPHSFQIMSILPSNLKPYFTFHLLNFCHRFILIMLTKERLGFFWEKLNCGTTEFFRVLSNYYSLSYRN